MAEHVWGDEWFQKHSKEFNIAVELIEESMKKQGLHIMLKEKYGTIRYEHIFKDHEIADGRENWKILFNIVKEVIIEYPSLEAELMQDLAVREEIVGKEIHDLYWTTL